jgi:hypothetical protein
MFFFYCSDVFDVDYRINKTSDERIRNEWNEWNEWKEEKRKKNQENWFDERKLNFWNELSFFS